MHLYLSSKSFLSELKEEDQVSIPKLACGAFSNLLELYILACVPISVVREEKVGVVPEVSFPASLSPGIQVVVCELEEE